MMLQGLILVLSCLGLAQALFLCGYLFTLKKGNRRANVFLAFMLLGLTVRIGKSVLNNYLILEPWVRNLGISGILIVGPFLWFYGKVLLERNRPFSSESYLHLLPFVLFVVLSPVIPNTGNFESYVSYAMVLFHLAVYLGLSAHYLFKVRRPMDTGLFGWYRTLVIGVGLIWFFYFGIFVGFIPFYLGGAIFFSFLVYAFSYLMLKRHVFALEKYPNSALDKDTAASIVQKTKQLFQIEALYTEPNVSLKNVAERLGVPPRKLSQAINTMEGKNFSGFMNQYRVERAKRLLLRPDHLTEKMATIAYECGFGNVTSFNLAFKSETGQTPSQYRNQLAP